jgi:hypothetical protein
MADAANAIQFLALATHGTLEAQDVTYAATGKLSMQHFISQDIGERHWE